MNIVWKFRFHDTLGTSPKIFLGGTLLHTAISSVKIPRALNLPTCESPAQSFVSFILSPEQGKADRGISWRVDVELVTLALVVPVEV